MTEREQQRDGEQTGVPQDEAARSTRAVQDAHGGSMAPGLVDDTGHPVAQAPADRLAETEGEDNASGYAEKVITEDGI
ncbi:hypothetical protein ABTW72_02825 [Micromonospora sp. NPDC127501]|uniref:hypothetical protein n=1 Tax=Micromonospora sp. NPDC127501 TaxID=3154872 RepID=UPI00332E9940